MKKSKQRSVYVDHEDWEKAKEMAWQRRMSVSALFVRMLDQESEKKPPRSRSAIATGDEARNGTSVAK